MCSSDLQLADQAATFMPRSEAEARLGALANEYEERIKALKEAVEFSQAVAEKAVTKAEVSTEKRFEAINDFRMLVADQTKGFISRGEFEALRDGGSERLRDLAARVDRSEGKSTGLNAGWGYLVGALGLIATVIAIVIGSFT